MLKKINKLFSDMLTDWALDDLADSSLVYLSCFYKILVKDIEKDGIYLTFGIVSMY